MSGAGLVTLLADLQLVEHQRHAPDQLDLRMILLHSCTRQEIQALSPRRSIHASSGARWCAFAVRGERSGRRGE
jgi:hypothetical protein